MSRNKREGKLAGRHNGRFIRHGPDEARKRRAENLERFFADLNPTYPKAEESTGEQKP